MSALAFPYDLPRDRELDDLLADTRLGRLAKQLVVVLIRNWAWFKPRCWPSNASIAAKLGVHPKSVPRALRELEASGWADRLPTDAVPTGRYIRLLWRIDQGNRGATPGGAAALPKHGGAELGEELRDVTRIETTEPEEGRQEVTGLLLAAEPAIVLPPIREPVHARFTASKAVLPIPAVIQSLKHGAPPEQRAELVNRITHRLRDRKPATYGFVRKWVNRAADGVAGALEALAHGYAKAEAAILNNHPCPGRVLVRRVQDFTYQPPAPSTIGAVKTHQAPRASLVPTSVVQGLPVAMTEAELVEELERARVLARRFGGGFKQMEADIQGQLDVFRARAAP
jgi:Helix-turn-helix domain